MRGGGGNGREGGEKVMKGCGLICGLVVCELGQGQK